jgi:uncharacterized membrane protein YgcG
MKCPSCHAVLAEPVLRCPKCELTLKQLDRKFGAVPRHSRYLIDHTEKLSARELQQLRALLRLFERKFPQTFFSVIVINLGPHISISEYAFWLINRARFGTIDAVGPSNFELLLVVDPKGKTAALTVGYALENYLLEEDLEKAVGASSDSFRAGNFAQGIRDCVEFMMGRLRDIGIRLAKESTATEPNAVSTTMAEIQ